MPKYYVTGNFYYNDSLVEIGETVEVDESEARGTLKNKLIPVGCAPKVRTKDRKAVAPKARQRGDADVAD